MTNARLVAAIGAALARRGVPITRVEIEIPDDRNVVVRGPGDELTVGRGERGWIGASTRNRLLMPRFDDAHDAAVWVADRLFPDRPDVVERAITRYVCETCGGHLGSDAGFLMLQHDDAADALQAALAALMATVGISDPRWCLGGHEPPPIP